ncbi:hypothetical protein ES705_40949 [subsurface metagenome]
MDYRQEYIPSASVASYFVIEKCDQDYSEQAQINNRKNIDLKLLNKLLDEVLPFTAHE